MMANPWEEYAAIPKQVSAPTGGNPWDEYAPTAKPAAPTSVIPQQTMWEKVKPYITSGNPIEDLKTGTKLAARGLIKGATTTSGMVADLPYQVANLFGANKQLPTEAQTQMLNNVFGKPEGTMAKMQEFLASLAGGAIDPAMLAAQAAVPKPLYTLNPQLTGPGMQAQTINNAMNAGVKVTPSTTPGAGLGSHALEAVAGKGTLNNAAQNRNKAVYDALANKIVGNPVGTAIDNEAVNNAIGQTYNAGYSPIENIPNITTGKVYRQTLNDLAQKSPEAAAIVNEYRTSTMPGKQAVDWIKTLRNSASDMYSSDAPNKSVLGDTYKGIANALEQNIGLNLPPNSDILNNFLAARKQIAQQYAVKGAVVPGTGSVNAAKIGQEFATGFRNGGMSPFTGDLAMLGKLAKAAPALTKFPASGYSPVSALDMSLLGAGGGAALSGNLGPAAVLTAAGLGRPAIRALMLSPAYQNLFLRPSVSPGPLAQAFQNSNVQNAVPSFIQNSGLFGNP